MCQKLGVSKEDQLHFFVNGLHDEIKRKVLMHKPLDYQSAENLARLKVSADCTIADNRTESIKDTEREILYKLLDKLTPQPALPAGSSTDKKWQLLMFLTDLSAIYQLKCESCERIYVRSSMMKSDL